MRVNQNYLFVLTRKSLRDERKAARKLHGGPALQSKGAGVFSPHN